MKMSRIDPINLFFRNNLDGYFYLVEKKENHRKCNILSLKN